MTTGQNGPTLSRRHFNSLAASVGFALSTAPASLVRALCAISPDFDEYDKLVQFVMNPIDWTKPENGKPRHTLTKNYKKTCESVLQVLQDWKYSAQILEATAFDGHDDGKLIGANEARSVTIRSIHAQARRSDYRDTPIYLVCAHLDTVAGTLGANDNATGAAAVLELARCFQAFNEDENPAVPIEFMLFGGEEIGLLGSRSFAQSIDPSVKNYRVINLDMLAQTKLCGGAPIPPPYSYSFEYFLPAQISDTWVRHLRDLLIDNSGGPDHVVTFRRLTDEGIPEYSKMASDHLSFQDQNISVASITAGSTFSHMHSAADAYCRIEVNSAYHVVESVYAFLSTELCR